jgi:hypothetical protein
MVLLSKNRKRNNMTAEDRHLPNLGDMDRKDLYPNNSKSVRLRLGKFYTNKEWEKRRRKVLKKKLP